MPTANTTCRIDKNIPPPSEVSPHKNSKWLRIIQQMVPGDSILVASFAQAWSFERRALQVGLDADIAREGLAFRVWLIRNGDKRVSRRWRTL